MIEIEVNEDNLSSFLDNIRQEDKEELKAILKDNYKQKFIKSCLNSNSTTYFLADKNHNPAAIGGVAPYYYNNQKLGQVWLLCSNEAIKNKKFLFGYIKHKVELFKMQYSFLFNYIYKSNYKALIWLGLLGFNSISLENKDYKFFYYKKEGVQIDIRSFTD